MPAMTVPRRRGAGRPHWQLFGGLISATTGRSWPVGAPIRRAPTGGSIYTSVCSAVSSASSTSMPRYRTVLSSFV